MSNYGTFEPYVNTSLLSDDERLCYIECVTAQANLREISDGCARVISSYYHDGGTSASASFFATGAIIIEPTLLWRELFRHIDYTKAEPVTRLWLDMMGTYLIRAGKRGPVEDWPSLWITGQN